MSSRVVINKKWDSQPNVTGVQRYAAELTLALASLGVDFDEAAPCTTASTREGTVDHSSFLRMNLWEQVTLPRVAAGAQVLFCPANSGPVLLTGSTKLLLTVHCLRFLNHPKSYTLPFRMWYSFMIPRLIERAEVVLTVSKSISEEISTVYPLSKDKLVVVYPGVSEVFHQRQFESSSAVFSDSRRASWVFVGNTTESKNLELLLKIVDRYSSYTHVLGKITLIGISEVQFDQFVSGRSYPDRVREFFCPVGQLNDPVEVAGHMCRASGLLSPTKYESFNLPLAEAMAVGLPALVSDLSVHREVGGKAPMYLPNDADVWFEAMNRIHTNQTVRTQMINLGVEQARRYKWSQAAQQVHGILDAMRNPHE